jgi:hypothetical protein
MLNESKTVSSTSRYKRSFFVSVCRFDYLLIASSERGGGNSSGGSFMSTVLVVYIRGVLIHIPGTRILYSCTYSTVPYGYHQSAEYQ